MAYDIRINNRARAEARKTKKDVEETFKKLRRIPGKRDYPACVCSCSASGQSMIFTGQSGQMRRNETHSSLESEFKSKLGGLAGDKSKIITCDNRIGHCAEQHAANTTLKRTSCMNVLQIKFSLVYRPRTLQIIESCDNCTSIFPQITRI